MKKTSWLFVALVVAAGCGGDPTASRDAALVPSASPAATKDIDHAYERDLARLRAATAQFHRYDAAKAANYTFLFMNMCMTGATGANVGGMGYHYVNTDLLDGSVNVETPEALLYEPGSNGQLNLVAVEYVIPKAAWNSPTPPTLFGRSFVLNKFDLWALHVWVWENNPDGMFADWNPRVSCANATP